MRPRQAPVEGVGPAHPNVMVTARVQAGIVAPGRSIAMRPGPGSATGMMLLSGMRAGTARRGRGRRWYLAVAGVLLLGFGVMVDRVLVDTAASDLDHAINGFIRIHIGDPSAYHHTTLPDGRQDVSFVLTTGGEPVVCHFGLDAAGSPDPDAPATCARP